MLARRLLPHARVLERAAATAVCGLWMASVGFHALAALRLYALGPALVGSGVLCGVALRVDRGIFGALRRDRRAFRRLARRALHGSERAWNLAWLVCAAPIALHALLLPPLGWDSLTYHAVKAAMWIQHAGALPMHAPGTWNYYRDTWAGADALLSWTMLPMHSDLLATFAELVQWALLAVCVIALCRALGAGVHAAAAAAGLYASLPTLRLLIGSGYSEPATCLCFAAACLFVVRHLRDQRAGSAILAAAAIGLALGMKVTFARGCAVLAATLAVALLARGLRDATRTSITLPALLAFAAPVVPWAMRAMAETGLPLSPLPVSVAGLELGRASPEVAWLMQRVDVSALDLRAELRVLGTLFGSPPSGREVPTALSLLPLGFALAGAFVRARQRPLEVLALCAAASADVFTFFSADMAPVRLRWPETSSRFLLAAMLICTALAVAWMPLAPRAARAGVLSLRVASLLLLAAYAHVGWSPLSALSALATVAACALAVLAWRALAGARPAARGVAVLSMGLALLGALAATRAHLRYPLMEGDHAIHPLATFWVPAARALDRPEQPLRIAVGGGPAQDMDRWFAYPFFGRELQNRLLYVSPLEDATVPSYGGPEALSELVARTDPQRWIARLRAARIDYLVTFDPIGVERMIAEANPQLFRRVSDPGLRAFGAFELRVPGQQPVATAK